MLEPFGEVALIFLYSIHSQTQFSKLKIKKLSQKINAT